jgi:hypothetical protein
VPGPGQDGTAPSVEALAASAAEITADGEVLIPAVACSLEQLMTAATIGDYAIRSAPVVGPLGGCGGMQVDFAVARIR